MAVSGTFHIGSFGGSRIEADRREVEDEHGKPIEVVTVGDARPSAQTDALLDATRQALVNAVTHGASRCLCIARPATRWLKCSCATMAKLRYGRHSARPAGHPRIDYRPHQTARRYSGDSVQGRLGHRGQNAYADRAESGAGRTSMSENETARFVWPWSMTMRCSVRA